MTVFNKKNLFNCFTDGQIRAMYHQEKEGGWRCQTCGHISRTQQDIYRHVEAKHVSTGGFSCPFCGQFCPSLNSLRNHKHRHHRNGQWFIDTIIPKLEIFPFQQCGQKWWVDWLSWETVTTSAFFATIPPTGKTTQPGTFWPNILPDVWFVYWQPLESMLFLNDIVFEILLHNNKSGKVDQFCNCIKSRRASDQR